MPMPHEHVDQLERLTTGATIIADFAAKRPDKAQMGYGEIVEVLRSPHYKSLLDLFHDDKEARDAVPKDATEYFKERGVPIHEHTKVTLNNPNWRVAVCVYLDTDYGRVSIGVHYDSNYGFGWGC